MRHLVRSIKAGRLAPGAALLIVGLVVGSFLGGLAVAALTVTSGSESGMGSTETASAVTWWRFQATAVDAIPGVLPPTLSPNMSLPSNLPSSNASYLLGPSTAGHGAIRFDFTEKSAPGGIEVELAVAAVNATGVVTSATVFFQTQFPGPSGTFAFSLFLDVGGASAAFGSVTEIAQTCVTHAVCP